MARLSRRMLLAALPVASVAKALSAAGSPSPAGKKTSRSRGGKGPRVVVVGAGAFGGWTALHLLRQGAKVTLLDAWGPGNSRASSGGETRVIRGTYGPGRVYVKLVVRSLQLWRENEKRWGKQLYHRTGALWMVGKKDAYEKASLPLLREAGLAFEELKPAELARRYPQINVEQIEWAIVEKDAGYLTARRACEAVLEGFQAEGGEYRQASVEPPNIESGKFGGLTLSDGFDKVTADAYVFACGPWLGKVFPEVMGSLIRPTRQEVFFFGTPPGDTRFSDDVFPVWIDNGERLFYGIPGNQWRGFKVADDTTGSAVRPHDGRARGERRGHSGGSRVSGLSLSRFEEQPAPRVAGLSVRELSRRALHRGPPSGGRQRLDRGRRLGPRLQARPGPGRARRRQRAREKTARAVLLAVPLPPQDLTGSVPDSAATGSAISPTCSRHASSPPRSAAASNPIF